MIESILQPLSALAALALGGVLMTHVKSKGSSVLVHHASHGRLLKDKRRGRLVAEAVGILSLSLDVDEYRRIHGKHHGFKSFAQPGLDEEANGLIAEGFRPGRSKRELWCLFWTRPFSPAWQARQAGARLKAVFFRGPWLRRAAAWLAWGGSGMAAAAVGWLPGFVGALGLLLVAGSVGSYLELVSRHLWAVTPQSTGMARQLALSHWRLPVPAVPERWSLRSSLRFGLDVLLCVLVRLSIPADLPHHPAHHLAWDANGHRGEPAWTDAAQAFSDRLRADPALHAHVHASLLDAVEGWFTALEQAKPLA